MSSTTILMDRNKTIQPVFTPTARQIIHAAMLQGYQDPNSQANVNNFASLVGKTLYSYDDWGPFVDPWIGNGWGLDWTSRLNQIKPLLVNGSVKAICWVWNPITTQTDKQTMKNIIAGTQDAYITTVANECKAFGYPIYIRFGGEVNLCQSASGGSSWGDNPADFIGAWKRVVDKFRALGVTNVQWVWSMNCLEGGGNPPHHWTDYYPGDSYVDWVGIDLYQFGWPDDADNPERLISGIYNDYATRKPIAICEWATIAYLWTGVNTSDANRAQWMTKFFNAVESRPQVKWVSYFYWDAMRFESTPLTLAVYKTRIANSLYVGNVA